MAVKLKNVQKIILYLTVMWTQIASISTARLNVPRILLPYNTGISTNYSLEVKEGNCYKWSSSRQDLVSVTPIFIDKDGSKCSIKALVSVISRYPERDTAIIRAEDERTGQVLRCDVIVDVLHSIEIVTTTRVLFLEDAPEVFEVVATNDQGGTFSSLEGVPFQWTLVGDKTQTNADVHGILRFLKFADSAYKTPPAVEFWEKQNLHGSMILMEGSKTGSAKVIAKPLEEVYRHVKYDEVGLVIVANLNLKPVHVYLLSGTAVKFQLELIKQGKAYPISLPSNQYYLEVINESVAILNNHSSTVTALNTGVTNLVVKDTSISDQEMGYLPSASIYVTTPAYMTLSVYPGDMWSLQENKLYTITINIFDRNSHPIHITENIKVAVNFPKQYFRMKWSSVNGTYNEVQTLGPGTCQIKAKFEGVHRKDSTIVRFLPEVTVSQDVVIYQAIKVTPNFTLLPWDPFAKPSYKLYLKASGGTGSYKWLSRNSSISEVDQIGDEQGQKTRVTTYGLGDVEIVASDAIVTSFFGLAQVSVQPAAEMEILPAPVEIEFDGELILPLALYGYQDKEKNKKRLFSDCSQVPISVEVSDSKFTYIEGTEHHSPLPSNACRNLHMKCLILGYSKLTVTYGKDGISLKQTCIIACHKLLKPIHPVSIAVLAAGSSIDVAFEGGPRPWALQKQGYYRNMSMPKTLLLSDKFTAHLDGFEDLHVRWLLCTDFGDNVVQLEVGNMPSPKNPYPAKNQASVKIMCAVPEAVIIKPIFHELKEKKLSCPASDDYMMAVHSNQNLELELVVKDSMGRRFSNISSLDIKWHLSDNTLAVLESYEGIKTKIDKTIGFRKIEKNYQELHPRGLEGNLKVTAKIAGYKLDVLKHHGITINPELPSAISHTLSLMLVEDAEVTPKKISVFNTPLNKVYLNVTKGSGHFYVESSDSNKADVHYNKATRQIAIIPLDTGSFTVSVYDLCLEMRQAAVAQVQIYGISAIVVDVLDKVELSKSVIASVEVLNEDKIKIPASLFTLMNLQPIPASNILSVRLHATPEPHHLQALYSIQGLALGLTSLKFVIAADAFRGKKYSSELLPIQVFPPLHVNPDNITLVIGAKFQILCSGGPQPQPNIEYAVDDQETALVTTAGIIEAKKIGKTTLIARLVGQDKKGYTVVFSQDKVNIHVVSLQGIKIHTPLTRMQAGTEMPIYAMGLNDQETPFAFGTAFPELKFKWSVNNEKVVSLHSVYKEVGIQEKKENNFCVRIHAKQEGHVTLQLEVTLTNEASRSYFGSVQILSDEVQIQVFEKLKISNPELQGGMVLLSPHSQMLLKCNRMGRAKVSYTVMNADNHSNQSPVVTVNEQGMLVSSSKTGIALLLVAAVEDFGITQRMTVMVKVEEVAYLMIKPVTAVKTSDWPLIFIPVGFTLSFTVSHHNYIGEIFHATRSQLNFRPSRYDLTRISFGSDNNTLIVQTLKPGYVVLKVWDLETSISPDYIRILAGIAIDPSDTHLVIGDVICFGSPLLTHEGHRGKWTSDGHFLSIHPSSGGAVALTAGTTTVTYSLMNGHSTATQVRIHEATAISIMPDKIHHISNVFRSKPYHISVVIQGNISQRINNRVGRNCTAASDSTLPLPVFKPPLVCKLQLIGSNLDITASDIFHTTSGFDVENGLYYCSIDVINKVPEKEISILDSQVSLSVHLLSQDKRSSSLSQTITFPFLPAFVVLQEELVLSNIQPFASVAIMATYAVQQCVLVTPCDPTVLEVMSPETDSKQPMTLLFPIRLRDTTSFWRGEFTPLYLEISCPVTKQFVKITVRLKPLDLQSDGTQCLPISHSNVGWKSVAINVWANYQSLMITFICIVATIAGLFIGCRALVQPKQGTVTSQPVFLNRTMGDGSYALTPPSHGMRRFSPPDSMYEHSLHNLSQQTRLWSLDDPHPLMLRRRSPPSSLS